MNYQVQLNNGQTINLNGVQGFDTASFTQTLNNREIQFVNIGGAIVNKNIVISITPVAEVRT
ncbi:hypothetical protein [Lysinibacillus sp. BW-2-10]|uniref:hypothetical protein n=1 Tax=Lysinibacillus sp. BW-2-10 TaxID=2590030 RepID=UPI00117C04F1|nr:hypothetical protein [Lysinibacillus sp. BW-2-10]TSI02375.1 hypothetical protein FJQ64_18915 [Lysinibacillus sp. BW-2-10]